MAEYQVAWIIDVEADSAREAAEAAEDLMADLGTARCFHVTDHAFLPDALDASTEVIDLYELRNSNAE